MKPMTNIVIHVVIMFLMDGIIVMPVIAGNPLEGPQGPLEVNVLLLLLCESNNGIEIAG